MGLGTGYCVFLFLSDRKPYRTYVYVLLTLRFISAAATASVICWRIGCTMPFSVSRPLPKRSNARRSFIFCVPSSAYAYFQVGESHTIKNKNK